MSQQKLPPITHYHLELFTQLLTASELDCTETIVVLNDEKHYLPIVQIANEFWLTSALIEQLKHKQLWQALPPLLREYLAQIAQTYQERTDKILEEIHHCCQLLTANDIRVLLLKGAASILNGTYDNNSSRYMVDIDLLIPQEQLLKAQQVLQQDGYQEFTQPFDIHPHHHHHLPALKRANSVTSIELHYLPLKYSLSNMLTTQQAWQKASPLMISNANHVEQLSATHQFILAVAHSELADDNYRKNKLNLGQLHHIYMIARYFYNDIDWLAVQQHFERVGKQAILITVVVRLQSLFSLTILPELGQNKSLTDYAERQLTRATKRYLKQQSDFGRFEAMIEVVHGYRVSVIRSLYGGNDCLSLAQGYFRHLYRHLSKLIK
ncbi:nucleotidyltransferase family protein [Thalassotalea sp. G2M2-11]|uniref:nucleotidyltransferase family protein n=1 Tax=Thalassotalea sp. G2M2-11 TaxID=2787627 RepID=UPI0019D311ED|nr:nucleotidyltransferase family protein [Thalassotalea sp. G2M2-11]